MHLPDAVHQAVESCDERRDAVIVDRPHAGEDTGEVTAESPRIATDLLEIAVKRSDRPRHRRDLLLELADRVIQSCEMTRQRLDSTEDPRQVTEDIQAVQASIERRDSLPDLAQLTQRRQTALHVGEAPVNRPKKVKHPGTDRW